jgi:hypothetical protein
MGLLGKIIPKVVVDELALPVVVVPSIEDRRAAALEALDRAFRRVTASEPTAVTGN